jgi:GxxExxY protein
MNPNVISSRVIGCAMKVHSALGPGLLESAYQACLGYELEKSGLRVESQVPLPVVYETVRLDLGYRLDFVIEDKLVVEIKALEALHPVHRAQLLSYLRLSGNPLGLLINFHVLHLKDGIARIVNRL